MGREAAESLHHRPDAAATAAAAAAILMERSGCARLFPPRRRSRRETPRALIPPPSLLPPPSASLRTHAAHPAGAAGCPPFPLPSGLPALGPPPCALAHPAQPGSLSAAGREARRPLPRGESGEWKMAEAAGGSRLRDLSRPGGLRAPGRLGQSWDGWPALSPVAARRLVSRTPRGEAVKFARHSGTLRVETAAGQRIPARGSLPTWLRENGTAQGAS